MDDKSVVTMDNATQNGEQPSREDKNLWLSLLKEAHESTQDTFHKDGACWIIGENRSMELGADYVGFIEPILSRCRSSWSWQTISGRFIETVLRASE